MAKYYPRTEKKLFKNINYTKLFGKPIRILRTKEKTRSMDKYIKRNYESVVSQEVIQLFVSLCSIHEEQKSITSRQKQPVLAPIQAREFLTHLQMDLMDLRNLPCTCSCHCKHNWILHMIDHFTKYSEDEEEEEEEPKRACYYCVIHLSSQQRR